MIPNQFFSNKNAIVYQSILIIAKNIKVKVVLIRKEKQNPHELLQDFKVLKEFMRVSLCAVS
jgi:hypothetical protein